MASSEMIDLGDLKEWLSQHDSDPHLWHILANQLNFDLQMSFDVFMWIVDQPDCDAATAFDLLVLLEADYYLTVETEEDASGILNAWRLAKRICDRDETSGFKSRRLAPTAADGSAGAVSTYLEKLRSRRDEIVAEGKTPPWRPPSRLLSGPIRGKRARAKYFVEESGIYELPRKTMLDWFR